MSGERLQYPTVSVVVPSYNRPERLCSLLAGLAKVEFPYDCWDVIVVDDGSDESLEAAVAGVAMPVATRCLRQTNAGPGVARNNGARASAHQYLAFLADDCMPASDWLKRIAEAFLRDGMEKALIGGTVRHALPKRLCPTASHLLVEHLKDWMNRDRPSFFTPNNLAVHRESFLDAGGFSEQFQTTGEDREFCARWVFQGRPTGFEELAIVDHCHPQTLRGFLRQHFAYGVGSARYRRIHGETGGRHIPEPLRFYYRLVTSPFGSQYRMKALLVMILVMSQVANASGVIYERFCGAKAR